MITLLKSLFSLFIFALFSTITIAAELGDKTALSTKTLSTPPVSTAALVDTLLGLLLVLVIIAFLAWLLRKTGQFHSASNSEMHVVASLPLGPRERAVLLQVGGKQILVGVTAQQVQTLHVLEQPLETNNTATNSASFAVKLQQMMQQKGKS